MTETSDDNFYESLGFSQKEGTPATDNANPEGGANPSIPATSPDDAYTKSGVLPPVKEIFGTEFEYDDWDKVKSEVPQAIKQAKEYQQKMQEIEDLKNLNGNPFANESIAKWNEFTKQTGIDNYSVFNYVTTLDLTSADPIEIMVADEIIRNPEYIGEAGERHIREKLMKKHGVDPTENTEEEIKFNKIALNKEVSTIRERLKGYQEVKFNPISSDSIQRSIDEKTQAFKPQIIKGISDITSIPINAVDKDGKETKVIDFTIPESFIASVADKMASLFASQGLELNEKTIPDLRGAVINNAILENFGRIIHAAVTKREQEIEEQYDIRLNNPSALKSRTDHLPAGGNGMSFEQQLFSE